MQIIPVDVPSSFEYILFGDNQEANVLSHEEAFDECIDYILSTPRCFASHMGDEIEGYWISDPRYDPSICNKPPNVAKTKIQNKLRPLAKKKKLHTILFSNHTHRLLPYYGNVTEETCKELGIMYGTYACKLEFSDKHGGMFKWYLTHGRKRISSTSPDPERNLANRLYQLKQHLKKKSGDCILMAKGHVHQVLISKPMPELYMTSDNGSLKKKYTSPELFTNGYIPPDNRFYVCTGSFLKNQAVGLVPYTELYELDPVDLGYIRVKVEDRKIVDVTAKIY